jgi:predicted Zn-dependent peptidase
MHRRAVATIGACVAAIGVATGAFAQAPDRSKAPAPGPPPEMVLPAVQKRALSSGLPVWIVEQHEVPLVQVDLVSRAGADTDPPGRYGLASMMASMLLEGAGTRDSLALADAIDYLGAELTASSGMDSSGIRLGVPVARLGDALPLMADVLQRPTFPAKELDRLRQQGLTGLLQVRDNPAALVTRAFPLAVFGRGHRYATVGGTKDALTAMTVDDLRAAHARIFHPAHSVIVVVGDVKGDEVLPMLESVLGAWKGFGPAPAPAKWLAAPQVARREVIIVDKPGAAQSQVRIGNVGVARGTPDFFALTVVNTILGDAFTSRLNQNLREEHGYTYGAVSRFEMRRAAGPFWAGAGVQTDKTAESVREFFNEFAGMQQPVPADELAKAKNYVALGYPAEFETAGGIASQLETLFVFGLPDDYPSTFVSRTLAVTQAEVAAIARKHITPDRVVAVIVGDRAKIEGPLKALNLGPVRVMSVDEAMGEGASR